MTSAPVALSVSANFAFRARLSFFLHALLGLSASVVFPRRLVDFSRMQVDRPSLTDASSLVALAPTVTETFSPFLSTDRMV